MNALERIRGGLVVSCQAEESSPLHSAEIQAVFAQIAVESGATGIRADGGEHIRAIKQRIAAPVIGLEKIRTASPVYITPDLDSVRRVIESGADIVALDATQRPRPGGAAVEEMIAAIHRAGRLALADIATLDEALHAFSLGADCVATTLAGHTGETRGAPLPALELVRAIAAAGRGPVICEGGIQEPAQVSKALQVGAHAVVVGKAITGLEWIIERFVGATRAVC